MSKNTKTDSVTDGVFQPKIIKRNNLGLIEGMNYVFNQEGRVDWRNMIPVNYLYINTSQKGKIEKKYSKSFSDLDIVKDKIEDVDLIQLLGAAKFLLKIRGFSDIQYNISQTNENYSGVNCRITFIPNFETEGLPLYFEDNACAHAQNTNGFGQKYLLEMATNRAFARCVRNALGINIVAKEELNGDSDSIAESENSRGEDIATQKLQEVMSLYRVTFEQLKNRMIKDKIESADSFKSLRDIPNDIKLSYMQRIKKKFNEE